MKTEPLSVLTPIRRFIKQGSAVMGLCALVACGGGDDPQSGTLKVSIYGEEFIEEGIAADEFSDGWAVTFSRFLVSLRHVAVGAGTATPVVDARGDGQAGWIFNLVTDTGGDGLAVLSAPVPGGTYDNLAYQIAPATSATAAGNATAADKMAMAAAGTSVWVAGTASKAGVTKQFSWKFDTNTRYVGCETSAAVDGGEAGVEITIHGDHLFYDDLVSDEPELAFDLIASADQDDDGEITQAELEALTIDPALERYQTGDSGITKLWDFIVHGVRTLGHVDGEGHCGMAQQP